jgi:diaminohydroxyphosphoribosylaminopyrimidine deaminase/5-amino-6-(5-phosphoribosylamino)uracil reductase
MRDEHIPYMRRCLQLAKLGAGHAAPNPMVGAVLVYGDKIIGEGYHQQYGEMHAEVNCIASVRQEHKNLIERSTLYVSLEPCTHYGKTPPCSDLIVEKKIPKVVVGCSDPFKEVNGRGIEKLRRSGIEVTAGILEEECQVLNKRFFIFHTEQRPYIILKWAQTADSKIAYNNGNRMLISNELSNRLVHKWRSEEAAILIGTKTAEKDDPQLTNRLWTGKNPIRLVIDTDLRLNPNLNTFNDQAPTILFNLKKNSIEPTKGMTNMVYYYKVVANESLVHQILDACYKLNIQSILVEGGAQLLQSFIDENIWDDARIITNQNLFIGDGLFAPSLKNAKLLHSMNLFSDRVDFFERDQ